MTATLDRPPARRVSDSASRLRTTMGAVRLSLTALGVHKTLNRAQKSEAAETFGAADQFISAGKKLLDTKHPAFRAVTTARGRIIHLWRAMTLPFPELGIRLIRVDQIDLFNEQMTGLRDELEEAVNQLERRYDELRTAARERLGRLFDSNDYPPSLRNMFGVEWDYPSVEPPEYLQQINPDLYDQECRRVAARFDEALELAEQAFVSELAGLLTHLNERLSGTADGNRKIFRDSAITNLIEFFQRFRNLNVRSNVELDQLVGQAQQVVQGIEPQSLRDNRVLRDAVAAELGELRGSLDAMLVDRPRRNIVRRSGASVSEAQ